MALPSIPRGSECCAFSRLDTTMLSPIFSLGISVRAPVPSPLPRIPDPKWVLLPRPPGIDFLLHFWGAPWLRALFLFDQSRDQSTFAKQQRSQRPFSRSSSVAEV